MPRRQDVFHPLTVWLPPVPVLGLAQTRIALLAAEIRGQPATLRHTESG